jgi:heme-degrading monooxygenase HmoA
MLFWLENGYKLNQINGNSGIYVATRAGKSAVLTTQWDDSLERRSEWFKSEAAATAEAEAMVRELASI